MAIYNFTDNELAKVELTSFSSEGILERSHLQAALKEQIEIISPDSLVIAEEFSEWSGSRRRIDLLAVDSNGNLVVVELKRNETGEHMDLQSLRYAAMVSTLTFKIKIRQKSEERRAAKKSQRDLTNYRFNGHVYNKRKLVLAVVQEWIRTNRPGSISELMVAFPQEMRPGKIFVKVSKAQAIYERQGRPRHFLADDEVITFPDSTVYAISNQWGKEWIDKFISRTEQLGYEIEEI